MTIQIHDMDSRYVSYLKDESKITGMANSISFPSDQDDVQDIIDYCTKNNLSITVQGGRTSLTGASVPAEGHIMNMSNYKGLLSVEKENKEDGCIFLDVSSGTTLQEINSQINHKDVRKKLNFSSRANYFFPVDVTETTATLGGMISTDARGSSASFYGGIRNYLESLTVFMKKDGIVTLSATDDSLTVSNMKKRELFDYFIGSEGSLGVILSAKIKLMPMPKNNWIIIFFFRKEHDAVALLDQIAQSEKAAVSTLTVCELFDDESLLLIEDAKEVVEEIKDFPPTTAYQAAVYIELVDDSEEKIMTDSEVLMQLAADNHCELDVSWVATEDYERARMRSYRHTIQERSNTLIARERVHNDEKQPYLLSVRFSDKLFSESVARTRKILEKSSVKYFINVIVGENIIKINLLELLPSDKLLEIVKAFHLAGGELVFPYGVGKINKQLYSTSVDASIKSAMINKKTLSQFFSSENILNEDNVLWY